MGRRGIVETPEFTAELQKLGCRRLDERLDGLVYALWVDAEEFPLVSNGHRLRIATVLSYSEEPPLSVYFAIEGDTVLLHWIEPIA